MGVIGTVVTKDLGTLRHNSGNNSQMAMGSI